MQNSTSLVETPTIKRRLISLVYEAFLVAAVVMLGLGLFLAIAKPFDPSLQGTMVVRGRTLVLFLVAGAYLIKCWTGSGHTLAMKTWRIKLVKVGYADVPFKAAFWRYVYAWGWILPALLISYAAGLKPGAAAALVAVGVLAWAMTALLDKDRQFLHDRLAGTRLILLPKAVKTAKVTK